MKWLWSRRASTLAATAGSVKLGHPVPDSNLVLASNSSAPHAPQRYTPSSWQSQYVPVNALSVPASRMTRNCSGVSSVRHSSSVLVTSRTGSSRLSFISLPPARSVSERRRSLLLFPLPELHVHRRELGHVEAAPQPVGSVDDEGVSSDVRGVRRAQVRRRPAELVDAADAAGGDRARAAVLGQPVQQHLREVVVRKEAGGQRVDADPSRRPLDRERLRQVDDAGLRRGGGGGPRSAGP